MSISSVAVFCGSKTGKDPLFLEHARSLGYILAAKNITVVYGGANKGIMGALADAVLEKGGKVIGVIPKILMEWEHQHQGLTELHEVADMHMRKAMFYNSCDAAIILPGGYGTMDELFETLTWNQLKIHNKKIVILNTAGFYDALIAQLNTMAQQGFLYEEPAGVIDIISSPEELSF